MHPDATPSTSPDADRRRVEIRPRTGWQAVDLAELWRARDLLGLFALRDITVRYKQTFFGYAWAVVVPSIQVLVFSVFFGNVLGAEAKVNEATGLELPYPLFALTGLVVWNFFQTTFSGASNSLMANGNIIRKIYIPRLILPLGSTGKPAMDAAVVWCLMIGLLCWYGFSGGNDVTFGWRLVFSPLILAAAVVPALALGLIAAALTVHYRDLQSVLPFVTSILFYLTPVIYSVELLPDALSWLLYLNPVVGFVEAHRAVVMNLPIDFAGLAISVVTSLLLLVLGAFLFARVERQFADVA